MNNFEDRLKMGGLLSIMRPGDPFYERQKSEIDALYRQYAEKLSIDTGWKPASPPKRWSSEWAAYKWRLLSYRLRAARRRVGLFIGGINPSELECDC